MPSGFPTRSDTNQAVQTLEMVRKYRDCGIFGAQAILTSTHNMCFMEK